MVGRREQKRTPCRKEKVEHLDNKLTAGQAQASGLFLNQRCLLQGVTPAAGCGHRRYVWSVFAGICICTKLFWGWTSDVITSQSKLAFTQKAFNQHLLYTWEGLEWSSSPWAWGSYILSEGMKHVEKNYKQYEESWQEFYLLDLCSSQNSAFH